MDLSWQTTDEHVDWEELFELYRIAPLGNKPPGDLKLVFGNSMYKRFVYHEGKLVGAGRGLADGLDCCYLADIAVHPAYQKAGIGQQIVEQLLDEVRHYRKIILYAAPGKEPFYKRFGFRRMLTAMAIYRNQVDAAQRGYVESE
ncbi:N-acetyltransferase [Massilia arenosa]|uniref:N-acetyltransferase n=1 Tax=Zemynaea arenosa TaxID=2561931 RepID=A0A4Y9S7U7_9BURK|nr:GNAT family N-acetyltransferase [Massilia arenosa]TFW17720.1 N-acetyltransferase [Massilia arenosa]